MAFENHLIRIVNNDIGRLFLSGLFCYVLAVVYNLFIAKRSIQIKHCFNIITGLLICYFNFGTETVHSLLTCLVIWTTINLLGPTALMVGTNFMFCMTYLLYGYYTKDQMSGSAITWTMPQCVLTLSCIALSFDIYDGKQNLALKSKSLRPINEDTALERIPTLQEILSKTYFAPTFLIGPQLQFKDFLQFVNSNENLLDLCWKQSLLRLATGTLYFGVFKIGLTYWPLQYLLTPEFKTYGLFSKLSIIALVHKIILCKYISGWLISEGSCVMYGISRDPTSGVMNRCINISLLHYETTPTFRGLVESFNISTNNFAFRYIFKRLKFIGSKIASQAITLFFLALWHGFSLGYYNTFALEMVMMKMETDIANKIIGYRTRYQWLNEALNRQSMRWTIYMLMRLHVIYMFGYGLVSFASLDFSNWSTILAEVGYIAHIVYFSWFFLSLFFIS